MSAIRLYVLGALAERGEMHGHALRMLAEQEHIDEWTDFTVGAVYGVLKRMSADGLIRVVRVEREGNYPERQVYGITESGEAALAAFRRQYLTEIDLRPDSFDLALGTLDPELLDDLAETIAGRLAELRRRVADEVEHNTTIDKYLWLSEQWAVGHELAKLEGEIAWHEKLLAAVPEIIIDERARRRAKGQKS
ncbi:PadR family transcriptional regulator [soil metagenome]